MRIVTGSGPRFDSGRVVSWGQTTTANSFSCCPYRKELDIKQRPTKYAIRLLRRRGAFTQVDGKGTQAFRTGQHYGTIAGGSPDRRFPGMLRIDWLLRSSLPRAGEEFGNFSEKVT